MIAVADTGRGIPTDEIDTIFDEYRQMNGSDKEQKGHAPDLGVWVKIGAQGNGYGKEAILELKAWADANLVYEYLVYPVDRRNLANIRVPEALGGVICEETTLVKADGFELYLIVYHIGPPV